MEKNPSGKYLAYFQNHTNTYGNLKDLEKKFFEAAECPEISGIVIATRPDCMNDDAVSVIERLSRVTFVMIELGFQTSCRKTAAYINRCYENDELDKAIGRLKEKCPEIHVVCHVIFGLPEETQEDMLKTVQYAVNAGADGIKIALLHVLQGTLLAEDYRNGLFRCMEMGEYFKVLGYVLERIPENIVIHRLTGDGAKKILIAPLWTGNKKIVLNSMMKYFRENGIKQGKSLK